MATALVHPAQVASRPAGTAPRWGWLARNALVWTAAAFVVVLVIAGRHALGADAHAYWLTGHRPEGALYNGHPQQPGAYLYSPLFAGMIWPLTQLPWPALLGLWAAVETVAFAWLLRPLGWARAVPLLIALCGLEISHGNIVGPLAVVAVVGMRRPECWAFALLTKVSTCLGPVWFLARGEWRALFRFAAVTSGLVAAAVVLAPHAWVEWLRLLTSSSSDPLLTARIVAALALTVFAARTDRPWLLAPALFLATPVIHGIVAYLSVLAAIPRLRATDAPADRQLAAATP